MTLELYSYYRSSASYRVRIALNYKGLNYTVIPIHLVREGGQQHSDEYRKLNPQGLVPSLKLDNDQVLIQSLAIMEYLEEAYGQPHILPNEPQARAYVRALSQMVACEMHPLNNLSVLQYLQNDFELSNEQKQQWYEHWVARGFKAIEEVVRAHTGLYCYQDNVTMADMCLVPQVYNAIRFQCSLKEFPNIVRIYRNCLELESFQLAAPENQIDHES